MQTIIVVRPYLNKLWHGIAVPQKYVDPCAVQSVAKFRLAGILELAPKSGRQKAINALLEPASRDPTREGIMLKPSSVLRPLWRLGCERHKEDGII